MKKIKKEDEFEQLRDNISRLEQRLQLMIKSQRELQKELSRHVKQESAQRSAVLQWIQQLSSDKKVRYEAIVETQNDILERHISQLRKDIRKELKFQKDLLKQQISRVCSVQEELLEVHTVVKQLVEDQEILIKRLDKDHPENSQQIQQKLTAKMDEGMNNIQNILKNYISDQSVVHLKLKNLEDKISNFTAHRSLTHTDRQLFELTPRDASLMTSQQLSQQIPSQLQQQSIRNSKQNLAERPDRQEKYTSYADRHQKPDKKQEFIKQPLSGYLDKLARSDRKSEENSDRCTIEKNAQNSESDRNRSSSQMRNRDKSMEQDTSSRKIERESSYSSKKIMDLRQKLKQFEQINNKYQKEEAPTTTKNAIQQLKQFKYLLENTESQIDLSNTFNQDLQPNKLSKERSLPKFKKSKH